MTTTTQKVHPILVEKMTAFYGTVEAARVAYRGLKAGCRSIRGECLWVNGAGQIEVVCAGDVQYVGSSDAWSLLP